MNKKEKLDMIEKFCFAMGTENGRCKKECALFEMCGEHFLYDAPQNVVDDAVEIIETAKWRMKNGKGKIIK